MAADRREVTPNKPPDDTHKKIISIGNFAAFALIGDTTRVRNKTTGHIDFDANTYTKQALQNKRISKEQLTQFGGQMGQAIQNLNPRHTCDLPPVELIFAQVEGSAQVLYKLILDNCTPNEPEVYPLTKGDGGHVAYNDLMFGSAVDPMTQLKNHQGPFYERIKSNKELIQFFGSTQTAPIMDLPGATVCHAYQLYIGNIGATSDSSSATSDCVVINQTSGFTWAGKPTSQPQAKGRH